MNTNPKHNHNPNQLRNAYNHQMAPRMTHTEHVVVLD